MSGYADYYYRYKPGYRDYGLEDTSSDRCQSGNCNDVTNRSTEYFLFAEHISNGGQYGEHAPKMPTWQVMVFGSMAAVVSTLTMAGNLVVVMAFVLERSIRHPSNYFIASLAVSDLLIGAVSMPLYTVYLLSGQHWPLGPHLCDLWLSIDYTVCLCSIYTVFCITADRFCSVTAPAKYRHWRTERKVLIAVGLTWIIPISVFFTTIYGWQYFVGQRTVPEGKCYVQYMDDAVFNCFFQIGYFWITLITMVILYIGIYRVAERLHRQSASQRNRSTAYLVSMAGRTVTHTVLSISSHAHHNQQRYVNNNASCLTFDATAAAAAAGAAVTLPCNGTDFADCLPTPRSKRAMTSLLDSVQVLNRVSKLPRSRTLVDFRKHSDKLVEIFQRHFPRSRSCSCRLISTSGSTATILGSSSDRKSYGSTIFRKSVIRNPQSTIYSNETEDDSYCKSRVSASEAVNAKDPKTLGRFIFFDQSTDALNNPEEVDRLNPQCCTIFYDSSANEKRLGLRFQSIVANAEETTAPLDSNESSTSCNEIPEVQLALAGDTNECAFEQKENKSPLEETNTTRTKPILTKNKQPQAHHYRLLAVAADPMAVGQTSERRDSIERRGKGDILDGDSKSITAATCCSNVEATPVVLPWQCTDATVVSFIDRHQSQARQQMQQPTVICQLTAEGSDQHQQPILQTTTTAGCCLVSLNDSSSSRSNRHAGYQSGEAEKQTGDEHVTTGSGDRRLLDNVIRPSSLSTSRGSAIRIDFRRDSRRRMVAKQSQFWSAGNVNVLPAATDSDSSNVQQEMNNFSEADGVDQRSLSWPGSRLNKCNRSNCDVVNSTEDASKAEANAVSEPCRRKLNKLLVSMSLPRNGHQDERFGADGSVTSSKQSTLTTSSLQRRLRQRFRGLTSLDKDNLHQQQRSISSASDNRTSKALRTITVILGAFTVCWVPWHVLSLIVGFCHQNTTDSTSALKNDSSSSPNYNITVAQLTGEAAGSWCVSPLLYDVSYWLCYLNSPLNPFCYALANPQFKRTFARIMRFDWHRT